MASAAEQQWMFEISHFQHTPARILDNMPATQELKARQEGVHYLLRCGNSLRLRSHVLSAASTYFHRFYMRWSIGPSGYDKIIVAAACLFLASKVEESTRKLRDVAQICFMKWTGKGPDDLAAADPWMDRILNYENRLLEALCFDIAVSHPHEYLADAFGGGVRDASRWYWRGPLANKDMVDRGLYQLAWSVANDSLRTPVCLFWESRLIACAAYLIAFTTISSSENPGQVTTSPGQQDDPFETPSFGHIKDGNTALGSSPSATASGPSGGLEAQEPGHQSGRCLTFEELLSRNTQVGPWMEAFGVVDADLGDLSDVIGNILELYNFAGQPGIAEVLRVGPPRSYTSLSGLPQSSLPPQSITTSNSSPALTLASNTTPMHRAAEDSAQDFVEPAEDQGDGSIPLAPAPNPFIISSNGGSSANTDMER
ncbi:hypothetical protein M407DRAFT_90235 [Tulasnella calospora MUT 4182]|uniref:Cyclin-like domain-containing protein n=1 Tax=Tulasnella calospora MUT 4182 TaxID=1051891 RepID=A0A0C3QXH5_9AGAM|nr:hypothetical protein M407DRAFT_90235 [Tulasnella calospora MUT 4182]